MTSGAQRPGPGPSIQGRVLVGLLGLLARLPEAPLVAAADAIGELWYRLAADRRAQVRANLGRVCEGLAATGRGTPFARRAGTDPDALERMVRAVFRHATRYYLEVARVGAYDHETAIARIDVETPDEVRDALESGQPVMLVGMHYGAIELPAVEVSHRLGHPVTAPMESVDDPALRHWFETSRGRVGVRIVPIANARHELLRVLRSGRSVGMVADRDLTRGGIEVPFFGHPAPIPAGPALVALEAGVPIYVGSARRVGGGRYRGRLIPVPTPASGTHRERVVALTASIAAAFEAILADAPEQWWGSFHPIWPDLVTADRNAGAASRETGA
jgi:phosphatidylinositol dimannoside acyltransferase